MTPHTSQAWHPWQRTALLLLALLVGAVGGTRRADAQDALRPDLQPGWATDRYGGVKVEEISENPHILRLTFFVHNVGRVPEWDPELKRWVGSRLGGPASNVGAQLHLDGACDPMFSSECWLRFVSVAADSQFTCTHENGVVTCSGGSIANTKTATITLYVEIPPSGDCDVYGIDIVVDPRDSIDERDDTNNAARAEWLWGESCIN
jgi:hypothetical protein